jgi:hypothetical protein
VQCLPMSDREVRRGGRNETVKYVYRYLCLQERMIIFLYESFESIFESLYATLNCLKPINESFSSDREKVCAGNMWWIF